MLPSEVARLLRVSPRWIARNLQPTLNRNRLNRFLWEDVLEQLRQPELPDVPNREVRPTRTPTEVSPEALALAEELAS